MKYFKFTQISEETGISWAIDQPVSGPSMPSLPGLTNVIQLNYDNLYYIGEVSDEATPNPENYCFEITAEQRAEELKKIVDVEISRRIDRIYQEEKEFRQAIFSKYDESATIAGIYKYQEAKELIADSQATAPSVRQEATVRGLDVMVLANRIVTNHEAFKSKEAKIAGIRGKIQDRLNNFVFDLNNADVSFNEFYTREKIGTVTRNEMENGVMVEKEVDVMVGKYDLAFGERYKQA